MDKEHLKAVFDAVARGELTVEQALDQVRHLPYQDLGFAKVDSHRSLRQGMAEVIFCPGKTPEQIAEIAVNLQQHHPVVLASRSSGETARAVLRLAPHAVYHQLAQMLVFGALPQPNAALPAVAVVTAGTADLPVAEEAALVLQAEAVPVLRMPDVGVAGIHRLLGNLENLHGTSVTIVVAGMDGALPSVLAGLLDMPVIAVPTSVGYGANFQGLSALLTMLNSCAAGLTVVNIDNGFGAAVAAMRIIRSIRKATSTEQRPHDEHPADSLDS
jgi:pyridinium-3,5-biscarboxylic acid mononucleotide synthase